MITYQTNRDERFFFMPDEPASGGSEGTQSEPIGDPAPTASNAESTVQRLLKQAQDELAATRSELQKIKDAELSEVERLKKQTAELEGRVRASERESLRRKVAQEENLPVDALDYLTGDDELSVRQSAQKLVTLIASRTSPSAGSRTQPAGNQAPSIDEQIAAAEKSGNRNLSISLKNQRMRG